MNMLLIQIVVAVGVFLAGVAGGIKWHAGQDAIAEQEAAELRKADSNQQRKLNDVGATRHAQTVSELADKLGDAREQIATLSNRKCLGSGTVRMLNAIGGVPGGADGPDAARAPEAAAAGGGIRIERAASGPVVERFATERDTAGAIAVCRARYAEVSDQLNKFLDREDRLFPPDGPAAK